MRHLLPLLFIFLFIACPSKEEDYVPLKIGNWWEFQKGSDTLKLEVLSTETHTSGKEVFSVCNNLWTYTDTCYLLEENDKLFCYETLNDTIPMVLLELPLEQDKSWEVMKSIIARVITKEELSLPAGKFSDCCKIQIFYDTTPQDEYYWYVSNVGLVKKMINTTSYELIEYNIE
jgi:hypothetical protein